MTIKLVGAALRGRPCRISGSLDLCGRAATEKIYQDHVLDSIVAATPQAKMAYRKSPRRHDDTAVIDDLSI